MAKASEPVAVGTADDVVVELVDLPVSGKIDVGEEHGGEIVTTLHGERRTYKVTNGTIAFESEAERDMLLGGVTGAKLSG